MLQQREERIIVMANVRCEGYKENGIFLKWGTSFTGIYSMVRKGLVKGHKMKI